MNGSEHSPKIMHTVVNRSPWWAPWLFLFIIFVGWASFQFYRHDAVAETNQEARSIIREAGIQQCERVNDLRAEINAQNEAIAAILETAEDSAEGREEFDIALEFRDHSETLRNLEMTQCDEAYPEDMEQAGFGRAIAE